jgi:2-keto-4-pentenoate hydratase/2-oxohepta-3-ene-1,7-dioic acid hydratase in catechol pathway
VWRVYFETQGIYQAKLKSIKQAPPSLYELLNTNEAPIDFLKETVDLFETLSRKGILHSKDKAYFSFDLNDDKDVNVNVPLDNVHNFYNFYGHQGHMETIISNTGKSIEQYCYETPVYYIGNNKQFIAHDHIIPWPKFTNKLDFELELAAVIQKAGTQINSENCLDYIFGYTILNDFTARDLLVEEQKSMLGPSKSKNFCSVLGPVIVTSDEFNYEEPELEISVRVNDQEWSKANTRESLFQWKELIQHLSTGNWIYPGDLVASGGVTGGCGQELDQWIQPGDKLELEIDQIGILKNIIGTPYN